MTEGLRKESLSKKMPRGGIFIKRPERVSGNLSGRTIKEGEFEQEGNRGQSLQLEARGTVVWVYRFEKRGG